MGLLQSVLTTWETLQRRQTLFSISLLGTDMDDVLLASYVLIINTNSCFLCERVYGKVVGQTIVLVGRMTRPPAKECVAEGR